MVCRVTGMIFPVSERARENRPDSMRFYAVECVAAAMKTEVLANLCQATSKVSVAEANCERKRVMSWAQYAVLRSSSYNALGPLLLSRCRLCNRSAKGHTAKARHGTNMLTLIRTSGGYRQQSRTEMHEAMLPACWLPTWLPTLSLQVLALPIM